MTRQRAIALCGFTAAVALSACGHAGINHSCSEVAASTDRTSIVFARKGEAVRIRDGKRTVVRSSCIGGSPDILLVFPDGDRAFLFGTANNIAFDWWGHGGRHVSVSCTVDFRRGTASPGGLPIGALADESRTPLAVVSGRSGNIYAWRPSSGARGLEIVRGKDYTTADLEMPQSTALCRVGDDGTTLYIACFQDAPRRIHVTRYQLATWPPTKKSSFTYDLGHTSGLVSLAMSQNGRTLAYWTQVPTLPRGSSENQLGVVDLVVGKRLFYRTDVYRGSIQAVEFDPRGTGVLVGSSRDRKHSSADGRIDKLSRTGALEGSRRLDEAPRGIYWTRPRNALYDDGCSLYDVPLRKLTPHRAP